MQPRIRVGVGDADLDAPDGWLSTWPTAADVPVPARSAAELLESARHGAVEREERPHSPETIPITLEAMTYGRHAADEGWAVPRSTVPGRVQRPGRQLWWQAARDLAQRAQDRLIGRSG